MLESFLVTSRETLEASLVVGIVLSYLSRTNNQEYRKSVYYAVIFGILASILTAFSFTFFAGGFEGNSEKIFEGATMLIGAFLLTTMIIWMMRQRNISKNIENKIERHLVTNVSFMSHFGIFMLVFIAIIREGVETVIFLNAVNYANGLNFIGGTLGVIAAISVGYLFFISTKKFNLKKLFTVSSILLILFAAGLVGHAVHEFEEAKLVGGIITPLYDINPALNADGSYPALHEKGLIGSFLKGLFGYNGNPSLLEIVAYFSYLGVILYIFIGNTRLVSHQ
jgi:high-affinity iron transporter